MLAKNNKEHAATAATSAGDNSAPRTEVTNLSLKEKLS